MFKVLLWDIDGTILDFKAAEKVAIKNCFKIIGGLGECTDEMIEKYSAINHKYWEALERGEMLKKDILVYRFRDFFNLYGLDSSKAEAFNNEYQIRLGDTVVFRDDCKPLIEGLKGKVLQCAVTNGTKEAQTRKLKNSGLDVVFDDVFISDVVGVEKPGAEFFDKVFETIDIEGKGISKDEILIIGDSLTSDIKGGNNAGIKTCWYNPFNAVNDKGVAVDYDIKNLEEVLKLVAK